ncbi:MAG TPA: hypothetical protein VGF88_14255 [Acidobacteriaceae bacterium]|jgi:hypothetical protein
MTKSLRVAVLTIAFSLFAAPVFAGPGGTDPPPPPPTKGQSAATAAIVAGTILTALGY